jgi:hypothetical protein
MQVAFQRQMYAAAPETKVIPKPREACARFLQRARRGEESALLLLKFTMMLA